MKSFKSILFFALPLVTLSSCTKEDAYEIPPIKQVIFEENFNSNASVEISQMYKATGTTYNNNSTTLTNITNFTATSILIKPAVEDLVFPSGSNQKVNLSYVDGAGATVTIPGVISKYNGASGAIANGLSFAPTTNSDYNVFTGEAYLLVFPGRESVFTTGSNVTVNTSNPTIDSVLNNKALRKLGWSTYNQQGTKYWTRGVFSGDGYATFTSFNSGEALNVDWLISPEIDMDAQEGEKLFFQTAHNFLTSRDNTIELMVSTDYDGTDFASASWVKVNANMVNPDITRFVWVNSGEIDFSKFTGKIHFAFKVTGSGTNTNLDGTFQLDNIRLYTTTSK